jgi:hypothetical protein
MFLNLVAKANVPQDPEKPLFSSSDSNDSCFFVLLDTKTKVKGNIRKVHPGQLYEAISLNSSKTSRQTFQQLVYKLRNIFYGNLVWINTGFIF